MIRRLTIWIACMTVGFLMMAVVLAGAAHAQGAAQSPAPDAAGAWHGAVATPAGDLRLGLNLTRDASGQLTGAITSPDQAPEPIPVANVTAADGRLAFDVPEIHGRYEATWNPTAQTWDGTWRQGAALKLVLAKGPVTALNRPQVPAKPYPYKEEEVSVLSAPGVTLACSLTTPTGKGPFPGVVMITGSGAQDRDEALAGHRPFLVISDHLTRHGVSVLRCDDRGFAKSTGVFAEATSLDFAKDTEAEAAFLRARPGIDAKRVGLIGHSEGGLIAPLVAVADPKIAFIVLMAGPGVPTAQLMAAQRAAIAKASGVDAALVARNEALLDQINAVVVKAADTASAKAAAEQVARAAYPNAPQAMIDSQLAAVTTPWYRWFIGYDPAPTLAKVKAPILALDGTKDVQVVASQNLPGIRAATQANKDVTIVELEGLNHLFQTAGTGAPAEYGKIEETVSPKALDVMTDWIVKHTAH
ncbi:MAG: alpha/beta hydrolase [Proteobacteria bacterium]|nr:alpha/beta hydrolase [Pseudomonadota bacterium]